MFYICYEFRNICLAKAKITGFDIMNVKIRYFYLSAVPIKSAVNRQQSTGQTRPQKNRKIEVLKIICLML